MAMADTANYGFAGTLPLDGTKNFNICMSGTALNYFNGRVGIFTANPGSALEVVPGGGQGINCVNNGTGSTFNYALMGQATGAAATGANTGLYVNVSNAGTNYGLRIINPPAAANNWAIYSDAAAQSYLAGSVGVGVTAPNRKLHVSDSQFEILHLQGTGTTSGIRFTNSGGTVGNIYYDSGPNMILYVNGAEQARLTGTGLLGIGTASPTSQLDVSGNSIRIRTTSSPTSAGTAGNAGEIRWDSGFLYVCTTTGAAGAAVWKRAALTTV